MEETTKAIGPQFARELDSHVMKAWDMSGQIQGSGSNELWSSETKAFIDTMTLKGLFYEEDWVYIVVDLIGSKISSLPLLVMREVIEGEDTSIEPAPEHPLNKLLEQPNEWQDYSSWMYNTAVELALMGNAIIWVAPKSGQIITLPTENVTMQFDTRGKLQSYTLMGYSDEGGMYQATPQLVFKPDEICHIRRPNPSSLLWGLSPFIPGRKSVLFNRYSTEYLNAFYLKQATPGLALTLDRQVNEDVALRQLRSFEAAYQGRKNQRRTLILPKGVDAKTLTHSLSDQKLLEHIDQNRETICGLLKVPKHEVSLQEAGSLGSEEYKISLRNFWEATLKPITGFIAGSLTKHFQALLEEEHFLQFDLSEVDALKDDLAKLADTATKMLQAGLSVNEVRQLIWKQEKSEVKGSDDPYVLVSTAPAFGFSAPPAEELAAEEQEVKLLPRSLKLTPKVEGFRAVVIKQFADEEARTVGEMAEKIIDMLVGMTATALDVVVVDSDKDFKAPATKALPPEELLKRKIRKALEGEYESHWNDLVARTLDKSVEVGYDQMLSISFNRQDLDAIRALRARDEKKRRMLLEARGIESFEHISKTHTERIMAQITKGTKLGESITQIMRRVASSLGTPGELVGKAETIARTETLTAISIGQGAASDNASEAIPGLQKAWLTAGDDRVRDTHESVGGETIDSDKKFSNGLRHPRDIKATDPAEVINCRCTLLLLPPGENLEVPK